MREIQNTIIKNKNGSTGIAEQVIYVAYNFPAQNFLVDDCVLVINLDESHRVPVVWNLFHFSS